MVLSWFYLLCVYLFKSFLISNFATIYLCINFVNCFLLLVVVSLDAYCSDLMLCVYGLLPLMAASYCCPEVGWLLHLHVPG